MAKKIVRKKTSSGITEFRLLAGSHTIRLKKKGKDGNTLKLRLRKGDTFKVKDEDLHLYVHMIEEGRIRPTDHEKILAKIEQEKKKAAEKFKKQMDDALTLEDVEEEDEESGDEEPDAGDDTGDDGKKNEGGGE